MKSIFRINNICRLCLTKEQVNVRIFEKNDTEDQLYLKISTCLPIQISRDDSFPKKICNNCSDKVDNMYLFWNTSASSEKTLSEWLQQCGPKNSDSEIVYITEIVEEEPRNNATEVSIEELSHYTKLEIVYNNIEVEDAKSASPNITVEFQNDSQELALTNLDVKIDVDEVVKEKPCNNTTEVSIKELSHSTKLEIVYDDIEEEVCKSASPNTTLEFQDDSQETLFGAKDSESEIAALTNVNVKINDNKIVKEEPCNNIPPVFIEELPHSTELEIVYDDVEEEVCENTLEFQDDSQETLFDIKHSKSEIAESTNLDVEIDDNKGVEEEPCNNTTDVSIEELPRCTTLEIVYDDTEEEVCKGSASPNISLKTLTQEFEFSDKQLPNSTILEKVSSNTVTEVPCERREAVAEVPYEGNEAVAEVPCEKSDAVNTCIVPTCDGNKNNTRKLFHPLPANEEIRKIWLNLISRHDLLEKPYHDLQQERVCGAHFKTSQYYDNVFMKKYFLKGQKNLCIVPNCDGKTNNVRQCWHSLPTNSEIREQWLAILNRPDLQGIKCKTYHKVCSAHFAPWQYKSPVSEFLNFRSIPLSKQDDQVTTNATSLPIVTPLKRPIVPLKRPVIPLKRPYSLREWSPMLTPKVVKKYPGKKKPKIDVQ